jgi:dUTP pyrophosphatase
MKMPIRLELKRVENRGEPLPLPRYMTEGSAGLDLLADAPCLLAPLQRARVPTGLALAIPVGYEGQVRPRSGLADKLGLTVLNAPGTIDSDYRGELQILLVNLSNAPVELARGERIAQLIISKVERAEPVEVADLPATGRGTGGFGSTGR